MDKWVEEFVKVAKLRMPNVGSVKRKGPIMTIKLYFVGLYELKKLKETLTKYYGEPKMFEWERVDAMVTIVTVVF